MGAPESALPIPAHPALAAVANTLEEHGYAGEVWDPQWRLAYFSSEYLTLASTARAPDDKRPRRGDRAGR